MKRGRTKVLPVITKRGRARVLPVIRSCKSDPAPDFGCDFFGN